MGVLKRARRLHLKRFFSAILPALSCTHLFVDHADTGNLGLVRNPVPSWYPYSSFEMVSKSKIELSFVGRNLAPQLSPFFLKGTIVVRPKSNAQGRDRCQLAPAEQ